MSYGHFTFVEVFVFAYFNRSSAPKFHTYVFAIHIKLVALAVLFPNLSLFSSYDAYVERYIAYAERRFIIVICVRVDTSVDSTLVCPRTKRKNPTF